MSLFDRIAVPLTEDKTAANWNAEHADAVKVKSLVDQALVIARSHGRKPGKEHGDWKALWFTLKNASREAHWQQKAAVRGKKKTRKDSMSFRSYIGPTKKKAKFAG